MQRLLKLRIKKIAEVFVTRDAMEYDAWLLSPRLWLLSYSYADFRLNKLVGEK